MSRALGILGVPASAFFNDLQREMNRVFDRFGDREPGASSTPSNFQPKTNLAETEKAYEIFFELPGVKSDAISIEFRDGQLWVTGERKSEKEEHGKTFHRVESEYGQFRRIVTLGGEVNADAIEAAFKDGILTVVVPKAQAAQPKRIVVKS